MERAGAILGYSAIVDKAALGYNAEALVFCNIPPDAMEATLAKLEAQKNVTAIYLVSGDRRVILRVAAHDNRELRDFVHRRIIPLGVTDVDSRIIMDYREKLPPGGIIEDDVE
jgi:DNA-binding Lrp family transcriptional regulator